MKTSTFGESQHRGLIDIERSVFPEAAGDVMPRFESYAFPQERNNKEEFGRLITHMKYLIIVNKTLGF